MKGFWEQSWKFHLGLAALSGAAVIQLLTIIWLLTWTP